MGSGKGQKAKFGGLESSLKAKKPRQRERERERKRKREGEREATPFGRKGMQLRRCGCPALILWFGAGRRKKGGRERERGRARNRLTKNAAQALPDPGSDPEYDGDTWRKAVRAGDGREEQKEKEREREKERDRMRNAKM